MTPKKTVKTPGMEGVSVSFYDKSPKEKVYTLWDTVDKRRIGEVRHQKIAGGWVWRCGICQHECTKPSLRCAHIVLAWRHRIALKKAAEAQPSSPEIVEFKPARRLFR